MEVGEQYVLCVTVMYVFVLFVCVDLLENEMMHLKGPSEIKLKLKSANLHPSLFEHPLLNPSDWAKKSTDARAQYMHACMHSTITQPFTGSPRCTDFHF